MREKFEFCRCFLYVSKFQSIIYSNLSMKYNKMRKKMEFIKSVNGKEGISQKQKRNYRKIETENLSAYIVY